MEGLKPGYIDARGRKALKAWYTIALESYFASFPTEPVTEVDVLLMGEKWTIEDKHNKEVDVSCH